MLFTRTKGAFLAFGRWSVLVVGFLGFVEFFGVGFYWRWFFVGSFLVLWLVRSQIAGSQISEVNSRD